MKQKVLLLNPPGKRTYIRDYFCSKVSQADYVYHPVDLLVLSATLNAYCEVEVIDAIAGRMSISRAHDQVNALCPSFVITLMGSVSWNEDVEFLHAVKEHRPDVKIIAIGDVFAENPERLLLNNPVIDAIILNFTTDGILSYLSGNIASVYDMVIRDASGKPLRTPNKANKLFDLPIPLHERFLKYAYRHPFIRENRFATVLLDYGCPFHCSFCIMKTLGYQTRTVESIEREFQYLHKIGITEILFVSQTFGADKKLGEAVCRLLTENAFRFGWVCFSRVDVATPEFLKTMKKAGCHTIVFGIESGAASILKHYRKGYTLPQIKTTLDQCRLQGIQTAGTFILGLPEETRETMEQTLNLLKTIQLDYASFNVAVPRAGTELREHALAEGLIDDSCVVMDQSGSKIAMRTKSLSQKEILKYRKRAVWNFYGRPSYLLRRLANLQSFGDCVRQLKQAFELFKKTYSRNSGEQS
jgi:anaerobic magnesium-protoporphyrin IX monomethyl ester cyclase